MARFLIIVICICISGFSILLLILNKEASYTEITKTEYSNFCGTRNFSSETSVEGKTVFNTNCASCHHLDQKRTGPALRDISQKYDSVIIMKHIKGQKELIKSKGFATSCINFPQLTDEDISDLLSYTN